MKSQPLSETEIGQINYQNELARKGIHSASILIPIIYYHIERDLALLLLAILFGGFFIVDLLKMFFSPLRNWYYAQFGGMLRAHEQGTRSFNGATFVSLSALILVFFFPKLIAIASFAILVVADTAAALVGRKFGKTKIFSKSLEGSIAFFVFALLVSFNTPKIHWGVALGMSFVGMIAELIPIKLGDYTFDDNLTIPLSTAVFAYVCYIFLMPESIMMISITP
ncbi:MAG: phosphatidate cytidylyltransferase [Chloroherpetonaceae bacterium]|nr:phosphatidate cytidylyltransferase [Chloroherpetonaceae bacterium]